jgi:hypothetical protein
MNDRKEAIDSMLKTEDPAHDLERSAVFSVLGDLAARLPG